MFDTADPFGIGASTLNVRSVSPCASLPPLRPSHAVHLQVRLACARVRVQHIKTVQNLQRYYSGYLNGWVRSACTLSRTKLLLILLTLKKTLCSVLGIFI